MTRLLIGRALGAVLLAMACARSASAQVGVTADIITGRVVGPDSQPLHGAIVRAVSVESQIARERATDADGRFTIIFPDGGGKYEVTARYIGMSPAQIAVARRSEEDRVVVNIRMDSRPAALAPVKVSAAS